jgi:hypothetical protein
LAIHTRRIFNTSISEMTIVTKFQGLSLVNYPTKSTPPDNLHKPPTSIFQAHQAAVGSPTRIFGPKREKSKGGWRKLHDKELNNLCSSPNIITVMNLRRMKWAGLVACIREVRNLVAVRYTAAQLSKLL